MWLRHVQGQAAIDHWTSQTHGPWWTASKTIGSKIAGHLCVQILFLLLKQRDSVKFLNKYPNRWRRRALSLLPWRRILILQPSTSRWKLIFEVCGFGPKPSPGLPIGSWSTSKNVELMIGGAELGFAVRTWSIYWPSLSVVWLPSCSSPIPGSFHQSVSQKEGRPNWHNFHLKNSCVNKQSHKRSVVLPSRYRSLSNRAFICTYFQPSDHGLSWIFDWLAFAQVLSRWISFLVLHKQYM